MVITLSLVIWLITLSVLAIEHFYLTIQAIKVRKHCVKEYAFPDDKRARAALRAHANFCENTPIHLLLLLGLVLLKVALIPLILLSVILIISRVAHAVSLLHFEHKSSPTYRYRRLGMLFGLFFNFVSVLFIIALIIHHHFYI